MILQNRKWCHCLPRLLANLIRENKMVAICRGSKYLKVFHGIKHYDYGSTATTKRHSYSVQFFRLLCSQTGRIRRNFNCSNYEKFEESYAQEINLIGCLDKWLGNITWTYANSIFSCPQKAFIFNCSLLLLISWLPHSSRFIHTVSNSYTNMLFHQAVSYLDIKVHTQFTLCSSLFTSRSSLTAPHSSLLTPRSSLLASGSSLLAPRSSLLAPRSSLLAPRPSLLSPRFLLEAMTQH